jgi:hypothetical protein
LDTIYREVVVAKWRYSKVIESFNVIRRVKAAGKLSKVTVTPMLYAKYPVVNYFSGPS